MTATEADPKTSWQYRLARIVTEALAPVVIVTLLMITIGIHSAQHDKNGLLWGLAGAAFAGLIPFAYIVHNVRRGRVTDHHVGVREQRRLPLLVGLASIAVGLLAMIYFDAPADIVGVIAAGTAGFAVALTISHWWKISIHSAVAAGAATILILIFGAALTPTVPLVALVAWSRTKLNDHTTAQVIAGALVGALVAFTVFSLTR